MNLSDLGEFGFIERIRQRVTDGAGIVLGIGDDCAAVESSPGRLQLTTTDLLIEGIHFRRAWTDLKRLGRKAVAVNLSDIAAMGGEPGLLFLGLGVPPGLTVEDLEELMAGFLEASTEHGAVLAGGDTCASPGPLLVSVTAQGTVPEGELVRRSGARAGEAVFVSGTLGDSALALRMLQAGEIPHPYLAGRHHDPTPRLALGRALAAAGVPTAMIDLSDGLLADLGHVLKASGVGACIELSSLPLSDPFRRALSADSTLVELALAGGEDFELLFTVPPEKEASLAELAAALSLPLTRVGSIVPTEQGLRVKDSLGKDFPVTRVGFNHFADPQTGG